MRIFDEAEIRRAVHLLHNPEDDLAKLFEVRIIDGKFNLSGYFTDADTLIQALNRGSDSPNENIYITLNYADEACGARQQRNRLIKNAAPTTSDRDVVGYQFLMIDLDPERAKGVSSADAELEQARELGRRIFRFMRATGWNDPIVAESGNGVHLLYRIDLANTPERVQLVKNCLAALDMLFSTTSVKVDTTTYNPARVCKLYGTRAQKGSDTKERPHRMSRIVSEPQTLAVNDIALVQALADRLPKPEEPARANHYTPGKFDLRDFLRRHGIGVKSEEAWSGGTKFVLDHCPFDPSHKGKDAAIFEMASGALAFHCFHDHCADKRWKDVRELFEPDAYSRSEPRPDNTPNAVRLARMPEPEPDAERTAWLSPSEIRNLPEPEEKGVPIGIAELDDRKSQIRLRTGAVTLLSGKRGCGKSSLISQTVLAAAEKGFRSALFSGEMTPRSIMRWLCRQAAGKAHVAPSQYDGGWYVPPMTAERIDSWLDGKFWLYDNDFGMRYEALREEILKAADEKQLDLVILDNMMCLDLSALDRDQFIRQSIFVGELKQIARQKNLHIVLIAHPRKTTDFLRLEDVAGSGDISNRVDLGLILHRMNRDFREAAKRELHWKDDDPRWGATNILEICKDRENGVQDVFIPLYFEPESKRLRGSLSECVHYGWEEQAELEAGGEIPF